MVSATLRLHTGLRGGATAAAAWLERVPRWRVIAAFAFAQWALVAGIAALCFAAGFGFFARLRDSYPEAV